VNWIISEDTHLTYDVDYTLELIDGNRHLVPKSPKTTFCPSRMYVDQSGLFEKNRMLGKQAAAADSPRQRPRLCGLFHDPGW
jgi:hypothetical protein